MSTTPLLLAFTAGLNWLIGFSVYRRNPRASQNRAFGFMATTISLWTAAVAFSYYGKVGHVWAVRFAFASASLIPVGVLAFIARPPFGSTAHARITNWLLAPVAAVLCGLSLTPLIVISVSPQALTSEHVYGPLHSVYAAYMIMSFAYCVCLLTLRYRSSTGLLKLQVRYLALAFGVPSGLAITTNLIAPIFMRTSALGKYGPFFSLLVLGLIGHAIIRHRLMDMRVVIKRSVVYLAAFVAAGLILIVLLLGSGAVYHDEHQFPWREILLALVVAVSFAPLKNWIQQAFDRYLDRESYDYQRTIRGASRALADTIDLSALVAYIADLVTETLKPESVAIYLFDEDERQFERAVWAGSGSAPTVLSPSSSLIGRVIHDHDSVFHDEVVGQPASAALEVEFSRLGLEVIVPLVEEEQVIGLICLGAKRSGDPYYRDDADLLTTLANQSAVAIRNAQTHQRVVQMNEELQTILGTIGSGVIAVGPKGKITLFNRAAEMLTGVPARIVSGRTVEHLPAPLAELIAATAADGQPRPQVELSLPDASTTGRHIPLVCSTTPLLTPRAARMGAVAVLADLSHLKELEKERQRAERLASLEAIASGVVHEIRNPLVAIKTFTQLLPIRFGDEDYRDTFSRVTEREMGRIEDLLTRLRTLSSVSSQPLEPVNIWAPLQDTLETLRPTLEARGVRLRHVLEGAPRPILGNAPQLEQLFLNLCLNAIEAMQSGGELTARVTDVSKGRGGTVRVEISDTGCGIPEDLLATIFDPFFTTKAHGTGLGLAICRSIADVHHARLSASSTVGQPGSTFTIEFPVPIGGGARVTT